MFGIFGSITNPTKYSGNQGQGLFDFLSNLFKLAGLIGGIYMVIQFIQAGYGYLSANGDPKKIEQAWAKIWQSVLGLVIIASAFVLAGVVERLTDISILKPHLEGP